MMLIVVRFVSLYKLLTMSTQEIKSLLHEGIENINDNEFLLVTKRSGRPIADPRVLVSAYWQKNIQPKTIY